MKLNYSQGKVLLRFALGDKTLFAKSLNLNYSLISLADDVSPTPRIDLQDVPLNDASDGFLIRSLPIEGEWSAYRVGRPYIYYLRAQYLRNYINLQQTFDDYKKKFSSKTRSTINRKVKKYAKHCGNDTFYKSYKSKDDIREFFTLAREVSRKTYQEKLMDAGLPDTPSFISELERRAADDLVRGYILFDNDAPVAYLYCPIDKGVLLYQYLGYDPDYAKLSVGTVLQWKALEEIFSEDSFSLFDFTEGDSEHKRFFATHSMPCADILVLRNTLRNKVLLRAHMAINVLSNCLGNALDKMGIKSKIKKIIRRR